MKSVYKKFNMPPEAYDLLRGKQVKMDTELRNITGKTRKIPMTTLITSILRKPIWFDNNELIGLTKRKRIRMNNKVVAI